MMKEIGITGGIGSGKSTVARIFESLGYAVYYADDRAKALYQEDEEVIYSVKLLFGEGIYLPNGQIDRKQLGGIVFQNKALLKELNAIVHPATRRDFDRWSIELSNKGYNKGFLLKEAAILFEAGSDKSLEGVIDVYAPKKLRLERVQKRDSVDSSAVLARMANQWPDSKKMFASDFIIYNDGSHMLIPQVQQAISFFNSQV